MDKLAGLIFEPEKHISDELERFSDEFGIFLERYKDLSKENEALKNELSETTEELKKYRNRYFKLSEEFSNHLSGSTPLKVFHNKDRKNTTVKFLDGNSVTVHLMEGDEDSLETALVYAIAKKICPKRLLKGLVKNVTETGGE